MPLLWLLPRYTCDLVGGLRNNWIRRTTSLGVFFFTLYITQQIAIWPVIIPPITSWQFCAGSRAGGVSSPRCWRPRFFDTEGLGYKRELSYKSLFSESFKSIRQIVFSVVKTCDVGTSMSIKDVVRCNWQICQESSRLGIHVCNFWGWDTRLSTQEIWHRTQTGMGPIASIITYMEYFAFWYSISTYRITPLPVAQTTTGQYSIVLCLKLLGSAAIIDNIYLVHFTYDILFIPAACILQVEIYTLWIPRFLLVRIPRRRRDVTDSFKRNIYCSVLHNYAKWVKIYLVVGI